MEHPEVEQQNRVAIRQNIVSQFIDPQTRTWKPEIMQTAPPMPVHPSQIPEYTQANPAGKRAIETQYQDGIKRYNEWNKSVTDEMNKQAEAADKTYTDGLVSRRAAAVAAHSDTAADKRSQAQIDAAALAEKNRQTDAETKRQEDWQHTEEAPRSTQEIYKDTTPMAVTASLPRYAVYDSTGKIDDSKSALALGKAYDLPGKGGVGPATGGLQRATTVANIASDAVTWNTHMATGDVHDLVDGLARGVYKLDAHPTPVVHQGQELDQFTIHQTEGDPGIKLFLPRQDGYRVARIAQDFIDAKPPPPPAAPAASPPKAIPGPPFRPQPLSETPLFKNVGAWLGSHSVNPNAMTPQQQRDYYGVGR